MTEERESLRILLVGNGGREHALAWKLCQSSSVDAVFVAPGNGGTSGLPKTKNIDIGVTDFPKLIQFAQENNVNLLVPGPEVPLVAGIEHHFRKVGIPCFGPTQKAARMEGSKAFSKEFMQRHKIPTARSENFTSYEEAVKYIDNISYNVVIKADGLAAGKGVIIPTSKDEAKQAIKEMMLDKVFGEAGDEVVIEEFLEGDEISILAFSDGYTVVPLPAAQDHKRVFDNDKGPNTGGMGCYAPAPVATSKILAEIQQKALQPTIDGMRKEGFPFVGILFTGFMLTKDGPKVLEYNVRFGDPETQAIMPLLSDDTDLAQVMLACCERRLDSVTLRTKPGYSVAVVAAAGGYPGTYAKNYFITLSEPPKNGYIFHAGTAIGPEGHLVTAGGRVLAASATAPDLKAAVKLAYETMGSVKFAQMHFRKDIAQRAFRDNPAAPSSLTYESAGVSIEAGNSLVQRIKPLVKATRRSGADGEIGGFGGLFDLKAGGFQDPVLVAGIDGIGTKIKVAQAIKKYDTIGIDLVAMNVNDVLVQGAEPLFFLDYYACGKLNVDDAVAFVKGVADACVLSGCALLGGETAEMPSLYAGDDFDGAGAAIGAVDRTKMIPQPNSINEGDILLGLASSGCHSNGFSLIRKTLEHAGVSYHDPAPWDSNTTAGESLLTPTRIYCKSFLAAHKLGYIKAASHITGGGFLENVPRMLPDGLSAQIDASTWKVPSVFTWLGKAGNIATAELAKTFNMGIGMVLIVSSENKKSAISVLQEHGEQVYEIGKLVRREMGAPGCNVLGSEAWKA